jgi:hypothetical protein
VDIEVVEVASEEVELLVGQRRKTMNKKISLRFPLTNKARWAS